MKRKKIAFVHYPHYVYSARLESMPFALNSVAALANVGWEVDLYLWEQPSPNYDNLFSKNVTIRYFAEPKSAPLNRLLRYLQYVWFPFQFKWRNSYYCVFGLGQIGAYIATLIARTSQCPFIYLNDEFPSAWLEYSKWFKMWTKLEQQVVKDAAMVVIPDQQRFHPLCQELSISPSKPHAILPNIPVIQPTVKEVNWHKELKLPKDSIPFLHAGSIDDWSQATELLSSVPYWHEKAVLVLHSQNKIENSRKYLSHLEIPNKVFWSSDPLPVNYLNSLVSYSAGNFALYRNTGPNLEYVGFSSGKLMHSLACGRPVIASKLSSLSFVTDHNLGVLVTHPAEIPNAIKQIMQDREGYTNRCLSFCNSHASFEKHWEKFCDQLKQNTKIDLRQSTI